LDRTAVEYLSRLGYLDFTYSPSVTPSPGRLYWNQEDGTLNLALGGGEVILQLGQEQVQLVRNATSETLLNGRAVRAVGADGSRISVEYADSNFPAKSTAVLGVLTQDIAPGQIGFVTVNGLVRDLDTTFGPAGSMVYLDGQGQLVSSRPLYGSVVALGYIIASDSAAGSIFVDTSYTSVAGAGLPCIAGPLNKPGIYKWEESGKGDYFLACDVTP
jgi:hypothetical protein